MISVSMIDNCQTGLRRSFLLVGDHVQSYVSMQMNSDLQI